MRERFFSHAPSAIRSALCLVSVLLLVLYSPVEAQPTKMPRIGYLSISPAGPRQELFRQGLRELGYVEGKNILIEWRSAGGKRERGRVLAEELLGLKVDVIVTGGPGATRPAKEATKTIPIVMTQDTILLAMGLSRAWCGRAGTSPDYPVLPRS